MKIVTWQSEVAVRLRLNLETLTLILKPQSAVFLGGYLLVIRFRVSGPTYNIFFMVWIRVRVICGYDVILNMSTAVRIQL